MGIYSNPFVSDFFCPELQDQISPRDKGGRSGAVHDNDNNDDNNNDNDGMVTQIRCSHSLTRWVRLKTDEDTE